MPLLLHILFLPAVYLFLAFTESFQTPPRA